MTTAVSPTVITKIEELLHPLEEWHHQCHAASCKIVNAELFPAARVARGFCEGVGSQHSWVVLGNDCYDEAAGVIDPTLWSYDDSVDGIWVGTMRDHLHTPHGSGSIWDWGRPVSMGGEIIELKPSRPFSDGAKLFLDMLGPLDRDGWARLAHAPVGGEWHADEILPAINECIGPLVPIDIIGMVTDLNPDGLYLPGYEKEDTDA